MSDNVPNIYMSLTYDDYKEVEGQCKAFYETSHRSVEGGYHKSFRLHITDRLTLEFQGPDVYIKKAPELKPKRTPYKPAQEDHWLDNDTKSIPNFTVDDEIPF